MSGHSAEHAPQSFWGGGDSWRYCDGMSFTHSESFDAIQLASIIDHTLLAPETTRTQCLEFVDRAVTLGVRRICIAPTFVAEAERRLRELGASLEVVTVAGFPSGAHRIDVKAVEAQRAIEDGAREIDFVAHLGLIKTADWSALAEEFAQMRASAAGAIVKVILETACLTDAEIVTACAIARDSGLDFVKTSTGFHAAGGATVHAVSLMRETVGDALGVKASGGIRSADDVQQLFEAGASRFGLSATESVLAQWRGDRPSLEPVRAGY